MTGGKGTMFLEGVRVLDLTTFLSGPFCTQILSDMGAEIIKIESQAGDSSRHIPPHFVSGASAYFHAINRNKTSVQLDLKTPDGLEAFLRLVKKSDIVVHNFRPGVMERLGLTPEKLKEANPRIVSCSISGFGETGPRRQIPAYDAMIQAWSGGMSLTGHPDSPPSRMGIPIGDLAAGMYAAIAVLAAYSSTLRTGEGAHIDVAMFDSQLALLVYQSAYYLLSGEDPQPQGSGHLSIPTYRSFLCADDSYIMVTANTEGMWKSLCRVIGLSELLEDSRFLTNAVRLENARELWSLLEPAFASRGSGELVEALLAAGVPSARVNTVREALADEQTAARNMIVTLPTGDGDSIKVSGNPIKSDGVRPDSDFTAAAPLGADTVNALISIAGYELETVQKMQADGAIGPFLNE